MTIPKWLLPVIAVIVALAVGVSLSFVGASLASKQTKEVAAKTEVDPVIAPAASGLSSAQVKTLLAGKSPILSPKVGNTTLTLPGGLPSTTPLQHEVQRVANSAASADGPIGGADPTPGPTPTAAPEVVHYVPTPAVTADDPCAPSSGSAPAGCPDGLHSAIFADSTPPPLSFTATPYSLPCANSPVPADDGTTRVSVQVLIQTTQPATIDVHYWAPTVPPGAESWHQLTGITEDPGSIAAYNDAAARNVATSALPRVTKCVILSGLLSNTFYRYTVTIHTATESRGPRTFNLNSTGTPVDQPLHIATFGNGGLVVSGDYRDDEQLGVRVFDITHARSESCETAAGNFREIAPFGVYSGPMTPEGDAENDEPSDITTRKAWGFEVAAGSTTLICGRWWAGPAAPSWDRSTPIRTSTAIAQAPDAILPFVRVSGWPTIDDPGVDTVSVSISTVEGTPCGSAVIYRRDLAVFPDGGADVCDMQSSGSRVSPIYHQLSNFGFSGNLRADVTVKYLDGHVGTSSEVLDTAQDAPTSCNWGDPGDVCGHIEDVFEVDIPYYPLPDHPDPNDGVMDAVVDWNKFGDSGSRDWSIFADDLDAGAPAADPAAYGALMNTDHRVTTSTSGSPEVVSANLDLQSNTPADYTMTLQGVSGPACMNGVTSLTAHGHVALDTTVTIPGLCYGAQYMATVTLTNPHGTTTWGRGAPESGWLGYFFTTPNKSVTVAVQETVVIGTSGILLQNVDAKLGGQELPQLPPPTCFASTTNLSPSTVTLRLPTSTSLHIEYRQPNEGGSCSTREHELVLPFQEGDVPVNLTTLAASPTGQTYQLGPVKVHLQVVPSS